MKTGTCFRGAPTRTTAPLLLTVVALAAATVNSHAQYTLAPGDNSSAQVNPVSGNLVQNWSINGINILDSSVGAFQGLYYSVGSGVPTSIQTGIGPLTATGPTVTGDTASLNTTYGNSGTPFSLQALYTLTGGTPGSANSDLSEVIDVKNNGLTALSFHFYQYAKFSIPNANVSLQTTTFRGTPVYTLAEVSGGPVSLSEYVDGSLTPGAPRGTITPNLVALTTTPGFQFPGPAANASGPGGAWGLEWDVTIPVNGTFILNKDLYATVPAPEPGTFSLISMGLLGFGAFRFYRRNSAK